MGKKSFAFELKLRYLIRVQKGVAESNAKLAEEMGIPSVVANNWLHALRKVQAEEGAYEVSTPIPRGRPRHDDTVHRIFALHQLGFPPGAIGERVGLSTPTVRKHLRKVKALAMSYAGLNKGVGNE